MMISLGTDGVAGFPLHAFVIRIWRRLRVGGVNVNDVTRLNLKVRWGVCKGKVSRKGIFDLVLVAIRLDNNDNFDREQDEN